MKRVAKVFALLLSVCLVMSLTIVSAAAADVSGANDVQVSANYLPDPASDPVETRGANIPTATWDLSRDDYSGYFNFNTSIYTNNKFKNHDGRIAVSLDTEIEEDDPNGYTEGYTMTVTICKKGLYNVYVDSRTVSVGAVADVWFENLDPDTEYYILFEQPYDHRAWHIDGTFTVFTFDEGDTPWG